MNSPDLHTIDEYLLGRLEGEELDAFQQQLSTDEELAATVHQHKELLSVVDAIGDLKMKERVRKIHQAASNKNVSQQPIKLWKWAIAACLVLAIGFCTWLWLRPAAPAQLYAEFYEPYSLNFGSRSTDAEQQLAAAGQLYKAGDFGQALPIFEQLLANDTANSKVRLAAGICQLELGQADKSLALFKTLIDGNDPLYLEQARWYSALAYLRLNDVDACRSLLETIASNQEDHFNEKAKALLSAL